MNRQKNSLQYHWWVPTPVGGLSLLEIDECMAFCALQLLRLLNVSHFLPPDLENCRMYHTGRPAIHAIAECITLFGSRPGQLPNVSHLDACNPWDC